jgi:hypothetical protein
VAWAVIALLACGLCYSIGFQSGWIRGADTVNHQLDSLNQSLHDDLLQAGDSRSASARSRHVSIPAG